MIKFEMDTAELHPSTTAWRRFWLSHVMTEKGKPLAARLLEDGKDTQGSDLAFE